MSPLALRRYRAERLLHQEFEALSGQVIATVRGRLRASGVRLDASDLEACYAQAWQGLYTAVLEGQEIVNPTGWLVLVTFRRAIEEHRARVRAHRGGFGGDQVDGPMGEGDPPGAPELRAAAERDLAAELDDRIRLRQLFEALRGRLSARELQAAALCYLQGLSRAEAAARMGVSEARMRKLMEGQGPARPGVAGKVGALVETIRGGSWCEEQGSLMRGFAYGVLDPEGERYRLALIHRSECPACRAYVLSLRGLAAVLPPAPWLMQWALGAGAATGTAAASGAGAGAGAGASSGAAAGLGAPTAPGVGGAMSASGAAGASAAGGSWLLAGSPAGAKLAVGCLLALGFGAGCVALSDRGPRAPAPVHGRHSARAAPSGAAAGLRPDGAPLLQTGAGTASVRARALEASAPAAALTPARRAGREFGPEQAPETTGAQSVGSAPARQAANAGSGSPSAEGAAVAEAPAREFAAPPKRARSVRTPAALREFAPG